MPSNWTTPEILGLLGVIITAILTYAARGTDASSRKKTSEKLGVEIESSTQEMLITSVQLVREDVARLQGDNSGLRERLHGVEESDRAKGERIHNLENEIERLNHANADLTSQAERFRNRVAELEINANAQATDTAQLKLKAVTLGRTVAEHEQKIVDQQKQIEELERENETLWEGLNTLTAQVKELGHEPRFIPPSRTKKAKATNGSQDHK